MVMTLAQNRDPSFLYVPAFVAEMALASGPLQFFLHLARGVLRRDRSIDKWPPDDFVALIAVNPLGSPVPGRNLPFGIQQEQRVILHPGRNDLLGELFVRPARLRSCRAAPGDGEPATRSPWRCTRLPVDLRPRRRVEAFLPARPLRETPATVPECTGLISGAAKSSRLLPMIFSRGMPRVACADARLAGSGDRCRRSESARKVGTRSRGTAFELLRAMFGEPVRRTLVRGRGVHDGLSPYTAIRRGNRALAKPASADRE